MSTSRLESFSDGVLAVAITLLILNIQVPLPPAGQRALHWDLAHELGHLWPQYVAYVISFTTIGIIWITHHAMVARLREVDHAIMFLNLLLLMSVVLLPFATNLMAAYLRAGRGDHLAAAVYGGSLLLMAVLFGAMQSHILLSKHHLLVEPMSDERRRQMLARALGGVTPYLLATALAVVSPYATLAITAAVAAFYAFPFASGN